MGGAWVRRAWERKDLLGRLLWIVVVPLSLCYFLAVQIRNLLYALEWLPVKGLPSAVISVGNLTVGGTGKTPTTLWLGRELAGRGYRVAILSRGYKRNRRQPKLLEPSARARLSLGSGDDVSEAGDEPLMMAKVFGQRVGVGKNRYEVGMHLLQQIQVDVFLLDDGFQHRQLKRDLDLLILGSNGRGWVLPAGPFREPRTALRRADLYLVTGSAAEWRPYLDGRPKESIYVGSLRPRALLALERSEWKDYPLSLLDRSKILVVSAIANPSSLYRMIYEWEGDIVDTMEFPDHYHYSARDWQRISRAARNVDLVVTTEKDILKLIRFPFAKEKLFALRVEMVVENGAELIRAVERTIQSKRGEA
jgi:tetraacyldisaccharide 4'-kinase